MMKGKHRCFKTSIVFTLISVICFLLMLIFININREEIPQYVLEREQFVLDVTTTVATVTNVTIASLQVNSLVSEEYKRKLTISCASIFAGNKTEMDRAKTIKYIPITDIAMTENVLSDCTSYKMARGYVTSDVSEEERKFPIAYSILTHARIDQLERLLRAIYRPQNVYCIHVDRKSKQSFVDAVMALADCLPNVFLTHKREVVVHSGFTRLQADLNCFKDLLQYDWKYILNYASSEFPLWPNRDLVRILRLLNGSNIFERRINVNAERWTQKYITIVNETENSGRIVNTGQPYSQPPLNLVITKGSAYGVFSRRFVQYVFTDYRAFQLLNWSRYTYSPDEHYWSTLNNLIDNPNLETPGGSKHKAIDNLYLPRIVDWGTGKCHGKYQRGVCVFGVGDLPWLLSRPELIANKFDALVDTIAYDCIEELLYSRQQFKNSLDENFYKHRFSLQYVEKGAKSL